MFNEFHDRKLNVSRLNYSIITLLPKVADATKIQQFRPICLSNCLYKWITKVLTLRIAPYAKRLIDIAQFAFMQGRNIMNGVMALHEILHETKHRKEVGVVLKLDFEKAYDKVNWGFMIDRLKLRGFSERWCSWIHQLVTEGLSV